MSLYPALVVDSYLTGEPRIMDIYVEEVLKHRGLADDREFSDQLTRIVTESDLADLAYGIVSRKAGVGQALDLIRNMIAVGFHVDNGSAYETPRFNSNYLESVTQFYELVRGSFHAPEPLLDRMDELIEATKEVYTQIAIQRYNPNLDKISHRPLYIERQNELFFDEEVYDAFVMGHDLAKYFREFTFPFDRSTQILGEVLRYSIYSYGTNLDAMAYIARRLHQRTGRIPTLDHIVNLGGEEGKHFNQIVLAYSLNRISLITHTHDFLGNREKEQTIKPLRNAVSLALINLCTYHGLTIKHFKDNAQLIVSSYVAEVKAAMQRYLDDNPDR